MALKHVVDAHALVWHVEGNPRLGRRAKAVLDDPVSQLVLPLITLAEAADVVAKGRTAIPAVADLLLSVTTDRRLDLYPLTWDVFQQSLGLTGIPDIHDRLLIATAQCLQIQGQPMFLLTRDATIVRSGLVPTMW